MRSTETSMSARELGYSCIEAKVEQKAVSVKPPPTVKNEKIATNKGVMKGGFLFPNENGVFFNNMFFTCHALERMAPDIPEVVQLLLNRAIARMETKIRDIKTSGCSFDSQWWTEFSISPRGIRPQDVLKSVQSSKKMDLIVVATDITIITAYREKSQTYSDAVHRANSELREKAKLLERVHRVYERRRPRPKTDPNTSAVLRIAARTASNIRRRAYLLTEKWEAWLDVIKTSKQEKMKKRIDIQAWKAEQKRKHLGQGAEPIELVYHEIDRIEETFLSVLSVERELLEQAFPLLVDHNEPEVNESDPTEESKALDIQTKPELLLNDIIDDWESLAV